MNLQKNPGRNLQEHLVKTKLLLLKVTGHEQGNEGLPVFCEEELPLHLGLTYWGSPVFSRSLEGRCRFHRKNSLVLHLENDSRHQINFGNQIRRG